MKCKHHKAEECLKCKYHACKLDLEGYNNKEYCKSYYQQHKEEAKRRTKFNRYKKVIEQRGYEMALYI